MPLVSRGFYIDSREERPYEVETTYDMCFGLLLNVFEHMRRD